jgi:rubredoxin
MSSDSPAGISDTSPPTSEPTDLGAGGGPDPGGDGSDANGAPPTADGASGQPEPVGAGDSPLGADPDAVVDDPDTHRFECRSCGYVYDPGEGVRKLGIESGTPFSALDPGRFRCPVCRSPVAAFKDIGPRNKPSGFEENLNFGLGVNRLTPGQKNVLIFGGFALAIAFFLSLYSLR